MRPDEHIDEEALSALIDDRLTAEESATVRAHVETCTACLARADDLRALLDLLHGLPVLEVPRDFVLGPRAVPDPPNLIRLRRWYAVTRTAAASLAAVFVFLAAGALYVDSQPAPRAATTSAEGARSLSAPAPAAAPQNASAPAPTPAAPRAVAPPAQAPAPAGAAAVRAASPGPAAGEADQVAAATSVRALPTLAPTPAPTAVPLPPQPPPATQVSDAAAPLRTAAAAVGVVAVLTVLAAVIVGHRVRRAANV